MFGLNKKEIKKNGTAPEVKIKTPAPFSGDFKFLMRPVVSEKAIGLETRGKYVFIVSDCATKPEIKKEVENKYGVKVEKVNMVVYQPEKVLFRGRKGSKSGFKKAIVKLVAGQKIEVLPK